MSGMHVVLINLGLINLMQSGVDYGVFIGGNLATWAAFGIALGAFFRLKDKKEKGLALGYFVSGIIGGVTEPALYGIGFKYKRPFIPMMIGGFCGGLYGGIMHIGCYTIGAANFLALMGFIPGGTANFVNALIAALIAMFVSAALTFFFGFTKEDLA